MTVRILLVNDSSLVRQLITGLFAEDPFYRVQATASNGELALRQLSRQTFDLVLLDVEMPVMNGIETLSALRREYPDLPVIMLSRYTFQGAAITVDALLHGAVDYQALPDNAAIDPEVRRQLKDELVSKMQRMRPASVEAAKPSFVPIPSSRRQQRLAVLAIGASTGGPRVLEQILSKLPDNLPIPVLIVQHIAPGFVQALAESLNRKCKIPVKVARHGEPLVRGEILLAPGECHLTVREKDQKMVVALNDGPPENSCRPAVDVLFRSVAESYGPSVLGVVLTGMGSDGLVGARAIREQGGHVLVQDQASSVVWGMPGVIAQAQLADLVLNPEQLTQEILHRLQACHLEFRFEH